LPDRFVQMVAPVAALHARKMAPAIEALVHHSTLQSALTGGLIARGLDPSTARMVIDQWNALGLFISPSVYAPAHVAEAVLTGVAVPTAQRVFGAQPSLAGFMAKTPGYEYLMAQPGVGAAPWQAAIPLPTAAPVPVGAPVPFAPQVPAFAPVPAAVPWQTVAPLQTVAPWQAVAPFGGAPIRFGNPGHEYWDGV
jgi:hypothetical protein